MEKGCLEVPGHRIQPYRASGRLVLHIYFIYVSVFLL